MKQFLITEDFPANEMEFDKRFADEQDCYDYLFRNRWPNGFVCSRCRHAEYWLSSRKLFICTNCQFHHSLTAGTIFHGTRKKLKLWFKALWWFTTRKTGISAMTLKALLGLGSYDTAWTWLHKLRSCTIRDGREKLSGEVEVDEIFIEAAAARISLPWSWPPKRTGKVSAVSGFRLSRIVRGMNLCLSSRPMLLPEAR